MRLLIISASAGAGHTRAACALEETARTLDSGAEVRHIDILDYTETLYKKAYPGSFLQMVNHAPDLWGYLYKVSDRIVRRRIRQKLVQFFDRVEFAGFRGFLRDFRPDAVLATHFLPCQVLAPDRRRGRFLFPLGVVVTDFDAHAFWAEPTVHRFFVASEEVRAGLAGRGIESTRISVTGIPIAAAFSDAHDRGSLRRRFGFSPNLPVVLVMAGGAGVGSVVETVRAVLDCGLVEVAAVAGRNNALKRRLEALETPRGSRLVVFGFVDPIAELMAVADLAVTKSGGLTTAECLAMGLPMIVRDPIPGQEERNCDFILEAGAGVKAHGPDSLRYKVRELLTGFARRRQMSEAARRAARPGAATAILREMRVGE